MRHLIKYFGSWLVGYQPVGNTLALRSCICSSNKSLRLYFVKAVGLGLREWCGYMLLEQLIYCLLFEGLFLPDCSKGEVQSYVKFVLIEADKLMKELKKVHTFLFIV